MTLFQRLVNPTENFPSEELHYVQVRVFYTPEVEGPEELERTESMYFIFLTYEEAFSFAAICMKNGKSVLIHASHEPHKMKTFPEFLDHLREEEADKASR